MVAYNKGVTFGEHLWFNKAQNIGYEQQLCG